jgi:hypothetical protein
MNPFLGLLLSPVMLVFAALVYCANASHMVDSNRTGSTNGAPRDCGKSLH